MASKEQLNVLRRGPHIWNRWREEYPELKPDLRAANLRETNLANADLRECDLRGAVLLGATLEYADLTKANLSFADLRFVELKGAKLRGAVFREAKGISPEMLRSAAGPSTARQAALVLVPLIAVMAIAGFGLVQLKQSPSREAASDPQQAASVLASTAAPPESSSARSDSLEEVQRALSGLDFGEWSVTRTEAYGDTATLRVDRDQISDEIYIPTLAGVCGILAGVRQAGALRQIHIVNREGWQGWTYQAPENCRALMRTPPTMMRLAIAGDSRPF